MDAVATKVGNEQAFVQVAPDVQVRVVDVDAVTAAAGEGGVAKKLSQAADLIAASCQELIERVHAAAVGARPDELEVAFSLALGAEGGWGFIAKATGEATLEVTAKWDLRPQK